MGIVAMEAKVDSATPLAAHSVLPLYSSAARTTILPAGIANMRINSVRIAGSKGRILMRNVQEIGMISIFNRRKPYSRIFFSIEDKFAAARE